MFLFEKMMARKPQKMTIKLTFGLPNSPQLLTNTRKIKQMIDCRTHQEIVEYLLGLVGSLK